MLEKIREILVEQLNVEAEEVVASASFKEDLGADSLDIMEMVMALEDEYGVEIPTEELETIETVQNLIDYLAGKGIQ